MLFDVIWICDDHLKYGCLYYVVMRTFMTAVSNNCAGTCFLVDWNPHGVPPRWRALGGAGAVKHSDPGADPSDLFVHLICCQTHFLGGSHVFFDVTWSCFIIRFCFKHPKSTMFSGAYCRTQAPQQGSNSCVYPGISPFPSFHSRAREGPRPEERQFAHVQLATLIAEDPWSLVRFVGSSELSHG